MEPEQREKGIILVDVVYFIERAKGYNSLNTTVIYTYLVRSSFDKVKNIVRFMIKIYKADKPHMWFISTLACIQMRLKRIYKSKLSTDDLYRNIRRNMSPDPGFSGNDFTYIFEFNKALENTKSLWYTTPYEHKVKVKSHSVFYWPRTEILFKPTENGTVVTVNYSGTILAYLFIGFFMAGITGAFSFSVVMNREEFLSLLLPWIIFISALF